MRTQKIGMKRMIPLVFALGMLLLSHVSLADTVQMNQTLVRLIAQIDAMFPLMDTAAREQDPNVRVQFHFNRWVDAKGVSHAGLRDSLMQIRKALVNQINQPNLTPKVIAPLAHDFVGR